MRILLVHNYYRGYGGEDGVFENERDLLIRNGHTVETFIKNNKTIQSVFGQFKAAISFFGNKAVASEFEALVTRFKPDIVHIHNLFPLVSPSIFNVCKRHNIPVVMTLHNYRLICSNAMLLRDNKPCTDCVKGRFAWSGVLHACYHRSYRDSLLMALLRARHDIAKTWAKNVSRFIVFSDFSRELFQNSQLRLRPEQLVIKPNFVPDKGYTYEKSSEYLFVGRLSPEKGLIQALEAFIKSPYPLRIIGDGPLRGAVEAAASGHSNICYEGAQPLSRVYEALKDAKALIFPSIWYEGCPLTLLEAYSCGTPVIASNIGNIPSYVRDGVTGRLIQPNSEEALIEAISTFDKDSAHYSQNARLEYETHYNESATYQKLLQIYENVIRETADT